jgi:outer membrane protein OmpA-like peptidoglycan-associated protein
VQTDAAEQEARRVADSIDPPVPSGLAAGQETLRQTVESKLAADLGGAQIHDDEASHRLAQNMGANAVTLGPHIHFNANQFQPGTPQGDRLIAHELTHVHQQQGQASPRPQFDLMQSLPSLHGVFEIEMTAQAPPNTVGMFGWIRFHPDPNGPYSAQIALIQIANVTDVAGATTAAGSPLDWRNDSAGVESGRMDLMTPGSLTGAPRGWFVDLLTARLARGSSIDPAYLTSFGESAGVNEFGWLRSPTDLHRAMLQDYPGSTISDLDFDFETVAKGTDSQVIYGSLHWGFKIRSGRVQDEYVYTTDVQSATFEEALERFRGYYAHEPVVIYFDTDQDVPLPGEEAKLADIPSYMSRYPDAQIDVTGFADERGDASRNLDLSLRRAERVHQLLENLGIDPGRLGFPIGHGETGQFAAGADAGTWRANRRVVIRFTRTATTPIRMP